MLPAGLLNKRITIQTQIPDADATGQQLLVWTDLAQCWASVRFVNGKEFASGARDVSEAVASIRIRYRNDLTSGMRILWQDNIFNIRAVLPDGARREFVDLAVDTGVDDG